MIDIKAEAKKGGYSLSYIAEILGYSHRHLQTVIKNPEKGSLYFWENVYLFFGLILPIKEAYKLYPLRNNEIRQVMYRKHLSIEKVSQLSGYSVSSVEIAIGKKSCLGTRFKKNILGVINNV